MNILITNDDGFDAPGLAALYEAMKPLGTITVVAPAVCHSARGHAVETKKPLRLERRQVAPFGEIRIAHASPADCVRIGLKHVCETLPDLVVAGINPGANLGVDLFYSGTAAAAREAAILGVPAIAVSRLLHNDFPIDWQVLAGRTTRVIQTLLAPAFRLPNGCFWNVNFPTIAGERYPDEITFVRQGTGPHAVAFRALEDSPTSELLEYTAVYRDRLRTDDCDVAQLFAGRLTATPIAPDMTLARLPEFGPSVSLVNAACAD